MGRPTDYKPSFPEKARKLCEGGATDLEVADYLDISSTTLYRWKAEHPEFREALKVGKAVADDRVERSLFNRAVGYSFETVKIFLPAGSAAPVYAPYREHCPPDTTAAIFWLKNRRPEEWREVRNVNMSLSPAQVFEQIRGMITNGDSAPGTPGGTVGEGVDSKS